MVQSSYSYYVVITQSFCSVIICEPVHPRLLGVVLLLRVVILKIEAQVGDEQVFVVAITVTVNKDSRQLTGLR